MRFLLIIGIVLSLFAFGVQAADPNCDLLNGVICKGCCKNAIYTNVKSWELKDTLIEGKSRGYTIGDDVYNVTLDYVSSKEVRFTINGESTQLLGQNGVATLSDGTKIAVLEILHQSLKS